MAVSVLCLIITVPWFGLQCVIVVFPGNTVNKYTFVATIICVFLILNIFTAIKFPTVLSVKKKLIVLSVQSSFDAQQRDLD